MSDITIWQVLQSIYPYIIGYIGGHGGGLILDKVKSRIHTARNVIDLVDNALNDPNVTDIQFKAIWDNSKALLSK